MPEAYVSNFKAAIDRVLDINFVDWRHVLIYIAQLESVLAEIEAVAEKAPAEALEAVLYFIQAIPSIFDSIHDETELAMFCEDLSVAALSLQSNAGLPLSSVVPQLLDAFLQDDHGRFGHVPERLARHCAESERDWLRDEVGRRCASADGYKRSLLDAIAGRATSPTAKGSKRRP